MLRRLLIILSVLAGIAVVIVMIANPLVATILRSERHSLLSDRIMLITMMEKQIQKVRGITHARTTRSLYATI